MLIKKGKPGRLIKAEGSGQIFKGVRSGFYSKEENNKAEEAMKNQLAKLVVQLERQRSILFLPGEIRRVKVLKKDEKLLKRIVTKLCKEGQIAYYTRDVLYGRPEICGIKFGKKFEIAALTEAVKAAKKEGSSNDDGKKQVKPNKSRNGLQNIKVTPAPAPAPAPAPKSEQAVDDKQIEY